MPKTVPADSFYYADGVRVELAHAPDLFAVEGGSERGRPVGRALSNGLRLVTKDELGDAPSATDGSKPKYPVFRSHGSIVVACPEVRVEEGRPAHIAKLDDWLAENDHRVTVVSRDDDRMVLKPVSNSGEDAIGIANDLADDVGPEMAQARFIRVTTRPKL